MPGPPQPEICGNGIDEDCDGQDLPCPVNHPPVVVDDAYETLANQEFVVAKPGVLVNDSDPDGNSITAVLVSNPTDGTLTLNAGGSFTYTPNADFVGKDTWVLTNANGLGGTPEWLRLPDGPRSRESHVSAYDPTSNRLIIYGGFDPSVGFSYPNDAWVLTNANGLGGDATWMQLSPTGGPPPGRYHTPGVYDPTTNRLIVALGLQFLDGANYTFFDDVWVLTPASLAVEAGQSYLYNVRATDPNAGDILIFSLDAAPAGMTIDKRTGLLFWLPTEDQIGDHEVTVRVQDEWGLFAVQTFTLTVTEPVAIVPNVVGLTQADAASAIVAANLTVGTITTANSDTVPAGRVISQAPVANTHVPPNTNVNFVVSLGPAHPPTLVMPSPIPSCTVGQLCSIDIYATDPDTGDVLTFSLPTAPAGMTIDPTTGVIQWTPTVAPLGDNAVTVRVTDPGGLFAEQGFTVRVLPATCPLSSILMQPTTPSILVSQTQAFTAIGICSDGTSQNLTSLVSWSSSTATVASIDANGVATGLIAGTTTISASAGGFGMTTLTVLAVTSGDTTPPTAEITTPADDATITSPTAITSTAMDDNFFKYVLGYAPVGSDAFTILTTGTTPVANGVLGTLDPTVLINDLYTLHLTVLDRANNQTQTSVRVQVSREQKVGNFTLAFQDLSLPVACLPITVTRTYDSRNKTKGDFGIGWRLDVQTLRLRDSSHNADGQDWHVDLIDEPGPFGILIPTFVLVQDDLHKISVTLPDGKVEEFDLTPQPSESQFQELVNTTAVYTHARGRSAVSRSQRTSKTSSSWAESCSPTILAVSTILTRSSTPHRMARSSPSTSSTACSRYSAPMVPH